MCEYCEGYKKVVEEWEKPHGYIDYTEAAKNCSLYQDEDPEGNGYTVVFGDGTVYEFLLPGVVDRLNFKYCPMCGRNLKLVNGDKDNVGYVVGDRFNFGDFGCLDFEFFENFENAEKRAIELAKETGCEVDVTVHEVRSEKRYVANRKWVYTLDEL